MLFLHLSDSYACSYSQDKCHKHTLTVISFILLKTTVLKSYFDNRFYEYSSSVHIYEPVKLNQPDEKSYYLLSVFFFFLIRF